MAFNVPNFNLTCGIFTGPWLTRVARNIGQECALADGSIALVQSNGYSPAQVLGSYSLLLLPAGTDVRDAANASGYDVIECPSGTGRFYYVVRVEDVGRGYPNEYRRVQMDKIYARVDPINFAGASWPTPIP